MKETLHEKYKLGEIIGSGGMGRVYIAYEKATGKKFAVKQVIGDQVTQQQQKLQQRALREYHLLSSIQHPNVVKAYDFFEMDNHIFMVMEFIEGVSLEEIIQKKSFSLTLKEQLAIAIQICIGIEVLNTAGIIHRDIKPMNIMIDEEDKNVKILDLGLGKHLHHKPENLTEEGSAIGTPAYMSPEQIEGISYPNTDVFCVGITLYQFFLWAKTSPFQRVTHISTWNAITNLNPIPLWNALPEHKKKEAPIYKDISHVLEKALIKTPYKRLANCRALANELAIVYNELSTDSTSIIPQLNQPAVKWKPGLNLSPQEVQNLKKLRKKYGNDLTVKYRKKSSSAKISPQHIAFIFTCLLLSGLVLGILIKRLFLQTPLEQKIFSSEVSLAPIENLLKEAIWAQNNNDYTLCAQKLLAMDKVTDIETKTTDPLALLIQALYVGKWEKSLTLVPEVVSQKKYGAVGYYYCLRAWACLGEYNLVLWHGNLFACDYPQLQKQLSHPVVFYSTGQYEKAFYACNAWEPINEKRQQEKNFNEVFLQIFILAHINNKERNWQYLDDFVKKKLQGETFAHVYPLLKAKINGDIEDSYFLSQQVIKKYAFLEQPKYDWALSHIKLGKKEMVFAQISESIHKYPEFLPIHILLEQFPSAEKIDLQENILLQNLVYECLYSLGNKYIKNNNHEKFVQLSSLQKKLFPETNFLLQTISDMMEKKSQNVISSLWQSLRLSPNSLSHPAIQSWFPFLELLPQEHKIIFLLDIQFFYLRLQHLTSSLPINIHSHFEEGINSFQQNIPKIKKTDVQFSLIQRYDSLTTTENNNVLLFAQKTENTAIVKQIIQYFICQREHQKAQTLLDAITSKDANHHRLTAMLHLEKELLSNEDLQNILALLETSLSENPFYANDFLFAIDLLRLLQRLSLDDKLVPKIITLAKKTAFSSLFTQQELLLDIYGGKESNYTIPDITFLISKINAHIKLEQFVVAENTISFATYVLSLHNSKSNYLSILTELTKRIDNQE